MKLLYTCADRADDPLHWSGTVWNCRNALENAGASLTLFDRVPFECPVGLRFLHQWYKRVGHRTHHLELEPAVLRRAAARITTRFDASECDAVFCPGTGVPVQAYLSPRVPVVSYLDATKRSWISAYFGLGTLCARSQRHLAAADRSGLENHALTIFSSDWAQAEAERDYQASPQRIAVVPFGANLHTAPTRREVETWITQRRREPLRLLFLGKEWVRKGGVEALAVLRALRTRGLAATLDIVGCSPALVPEDRPHVRIHGFLNPATPEGAHRFHGLLRDSHVLVFLSQAEAYGIALCEAAAHGIPAYALRVGGIPTIVRSGETGWLGDLPFCATTAATTLAAAWRSPHDYPRIARAARDDYERRLNWRVAGHSLLSHIEQTLARRSARGAVGS